MPQEKDTLIRDERYNANQVEEKWAKLWQRDASLYAAERNSTKPKYYVLEMLPYPSGALHMATFATTPLATRSPATCG